MTNARVSDSEMSCLLASYLDVEVADCVDTLVDSEFFCDRVDSTSEKNGDSPSARRFERGVGVFPVAISAPRYASWIVTNVVSQIARQTSNRLVIALDGIQQTLDVRIVVWMSSRMKKSIASKVYHIARTFIRRHEHEIVRGVDIVLRCDNLWVCRPLFGDDVMDLD